MAQMLVRPPEDLKDRLQIEAQRMGLTLNALVLQILWDWDRSKETEGTKAAPPSVSITRLEHPESEATEQCALF